MTISAYQIRKSVPLGTTNYLYDGLNVLEEVDNAGNILARYSQRREVDEPLAELRSGTASYYEARMVEWSAEQCGPLRLDGAITILDVIGSVTPERVLRGNLWLTQANLQKAKQFLDCERCRALRAARSARKLLCVNLGTGPAFRRHDHTVAAPSFAFFPKGGRQTDCT